jgi:hypothetical protein
MKSLYLRSCVAVACALSLAACGGSNDSLLLSGSISGLTKEGLVLQNNGGPQLKVPAGAIGFQFPELIGTDSQYDITFIDPPGAKCSIANGKGKTGAFSPFGIAVTCVTNRYALGGTVSGLDTDGLVVVNGSDRQEIKAGATTFSMSKLGADGKPVSGEVPDGAPYGVTILTQPAPRSCRVENGVGTMGSAPIDTVKIICA